MSDRIITRRIDSPLGPLTLGVLVGGVGGVGGEHGLCVLEFAGPRGQRELAELEALFECSVEPNGVDPTGVLDQAERQLSGYFAGQRTGFDLPLARPGTEFQRAVWDELVKIPHGTTISYAELARRLGKPGSQRAVGAANGKNRIAIVVPCHRVIDSSGNLHGYGGGLDRKRALLELEGAISPQPTLFV